MKPFDSKPKPITRRQFVGGPLAAAVATAIAAPELLPRCLAIPPIHKAGAKSRMSLGLAAYSFRDFFKDGQRGRAAAENSERQIDLFQFMEFCAEHGCHGAELTSYYFPAQVDREFLLRLRRHAFLLGLDISGTAVGNTFTLPPGPKRDAEIDLVRRWIGHAAVMGAPHIRVFAGNAQDQSLAEAKRRCIAALEECAKPAAEHGVFLGIENHGGITAEAADLLDLVRAIDSPWIGINLDTGNFHTDDPYGDLEKCAPYAVNVQVKEEIAPRSGGRQKADFRRIVRILKDAGYRGYVTLEYESKPSPWETVPRLLQELRSLIAA